MAFWYSPCPVIKWSDQILAIMATGSFLEIATCPSPAALAGFLSASSTIHHLLKISGHFLLVYLGQILDPQIFLLLLSNSRRFVSQKRFRSPHQLQYLALLRPYRQLPEPLPPGLPVRLSRNLPPAGISEPCTFYSSRQALGLSILRQILCCLWQSFLILPPRCRCRQ